MVVVYRSMIWSLSDSIRSNLYTSLLPREKMCEESWMRKQHIGGHFDVASEQCIENDDGSFFKCVSTQLEGVVELSTLRVSGER